MTETTVLDLAGVIYSSGKVFDGLRTGRLDTENFLDSGSLEGVTSRADLALLEDLRDVAQHVIDHSGEKIDAAYVRSINAKITRSGPLHPGQLRTAAQQIGVETRYGRHKPEALTDSALQRIIDGAIATGDDIDSALSLFVDLARAQPFEDGNKRTALFVANGFLLGVGSDLLLQVPYSDDDPSIADQLNDRLAWAYVHHDDDDVKQLLRQQGIRRR
ncbi:MAG: Fic family protein [Rhodococcus sp.]|nr:Fic family protein [Rhodococcus sp. (in: high G+C Gram-positive bacteria)]